MMPRTAPEVSASAIGLPAAASFSSEFLRLVDPAEDAGALRERFAGARHERDRLPVVARPPPSGSVAAEFVAHHLLDRGDQDVELLGGLRVGPRRC